MSVMWKGVLPVGSIVLLKGGDRKLMVCGICVSMEDDNDPRVFDYSGVLYPDGFEDPDSLFLFNKENIEQVYHIGYMDEDSEEFLPNVEKMLDAARRGNV